MPKIQPIRITILLLVLAASTIQSRPQSTEKSGDLKNQVRLNYIVDLFNKDFNRDPWQVAALSYSRKTHLGTLIARLNVADRYHITGVQGEVDAWPKFGKKDYGYLNYGYSGSQVFPKNRAGAEWYHNFPKAFEASAGVRLLWFDSSEVNIITATVGKYFGNNWISLRAFITPDLDKKTTATAWFLQMRHYGAVAENYLGMRLGYGISPDDRRNLLDSGQMLTTKTGSARIEYNHLFGSRWILNAAGVYSVEQLQSGNHSGYYTLDISIIHLF
jgi:YaiO family outer membrane protein